MMLSPGPDHPGRFARAVKRDEPAVLGVLTRLGALDVSAA
jgi:hypothetical protein